MKVLITGGAGFLGQRLAQSLLKDGSCIGPDGAPEGTPDGVVQNISNVTLFDLVEPALNHPIFIEAQKGGIAIDTVVGSMADADVVNDLIDRPDIAVFHLASIPSGGCEQDFDAAMSDNLAGARYLFEAVRKQPGLQRLVFAGSYASYGGEFVQGDCGDGVKQLPQTTYGTIKTICELLINDYSRKGYFDGRTARLPTVIVRPGKPNTAASSFFSGVIREPLAGVDVVGPVGKDTAHPVLGYRKIIDGIIKLATLDANQLGDDRAVALPAHDTTVEALIEALHRVANERGLNRELGEITFNPDPYIEKIVAGWAKTTDTKRARALGLPIEESLDDIVRAYIDDYG